MDALTSSRDRQPLRFSGTAGGSDGLTLEQWFALSHAVFGGSFVCLINRLQPPQPSWGIARKEFLTGAQIVGVLKSLGPDAMISAVVYDGESVAHAIVIEGLNAAGRIVYWDPASDPSLLCAEQNAAGVAALPEPDHHWSVSPHEMEAVILAILLEGETYESR